MAAPNIVTVSNLYFRNLKGDLTTSAATVVNNPAASGVALKVISLYIANVDGTNSAAVTVNVYSQDDIGGTATAIASTVNVAADSTVVVIDESSPVYLSEDMSIGALASANGDLVYVVSYQELS